MIPRYIFFFFFSSRRRHTRFSRDWSSDVCSSDLGGGDDFVMALGERRRGGGKHGYPQDQRPDQDAQWATKTHDSLLFAGTGECTASPSKRKPTEYKSYESLVARGCWA